MKNAKADAALYLLTGLLQRLEQSQPGLIEEMKQGVESDRSNVSSDIQDFDYVKSIFDESFDLLNRINALKNTSTNDSAQKS